MEERIQKLLSRAGVSSRRAAEKMIAEGRISVNQAVVTEPGTKADADRDQIRVDGRLISCEAERVYLLLHKPQGYVTTLNDPQGPCIVMEYIRGITLDTLLQRNSRLSPERVSRLLGQLCEALQAADYEAWRKRPLAAIEDSGQQELLNWMCLVGGMAELGRRPTEASYVETYIFNSNKCFAVFKP